MSGIAWLFDEDLDNDILRGVLRRSGEFDVVRVQDVGLSGKSDEVVLEWAADHGKILVTHDVSTMIAHWRNRMARGSSSPGLLVVPQGSPIGLVIADIILIDQCSLPGEWVDQVRFLPLS